MVTNLGRTGYFCPIRYPGALTAEHCSHWTPISKDLTTPIIGIFHDPLTVSDIGDIMTLGLTKENIDSEPAALQALCLPRIPRAGQEVPLSILHADEACFVSMASFKDVIKVDVLKRNERCLGLRILHNDEMVEILGQWDPSDNSQISEMYSSSQGLLQSVYFFFHKPAPEELERESIFYGKTRFLKEIFVDFGQDLHPLDTDYRDEDVFAVDDISKVGLTLMFLYFAC
jgi:hypothetical protein